MICNHIYKVIPALQSRCTKLWFRPIKKDDMKYRLNQVVEKENIKLDDVDGLDAIIRRSNGDLRCAINTLQTLSCSKIEINSINVNDYFGFLNHADIEKLIKVMHKPMNISYIHLNSLLEQGISLRVIIDELSFYLVNNSKKFKNLAKILDCLSKIEYNMINNTSEKIQVMALSGLFKITDK